MGKQTDGGGKGNGGKLDGGQTDGPPYQQISPPNTLNKKLVTVSSTQLHLVTVGQATNYCTATSRMTNL